VQRQLCKQWLGYAEVRNTRDNADPDAFPGWDRWKRLPPIDAGVWLRSAAGVMGTDRHDRLCSSIVSGGSAVDERQHSVSALEPLCQTVDLIAVFEENECWHAPDGELLDGADGFPRVEHRHGGVSFSSDDAEHWFDTQTDRTAFSVEIHQDTRFILEKLVQFVTGRELNWFLHCAHA